MDKPRQQKPGDNCEASVSNDKCMLHFLLPRRGSRLVSLSAGGCISGAPSRQAHGGARLSLAGLRPHKNRNCELPPWGNGELSFLM